MPFTREFFLNNESINYPLNDLCTRESDRGVIVPNGVLAGASISIPKSLGDSIYLSSLSITSGLVSLTLLAATSRLSGEGTASAVAFYPVASLSVVKPVSPYRAYQIEPLTDGVGGFIVFGSGVNSHTLSEAFSDVNAMQLSQSVLRRYDAMPITSISPADSNVELDGDILLEAGPDLKIDVETVTIDGTPRTVISIGLDTELSPNSLETYSGPCAVRPENNNCGRVGIQTINSVPPDCDGDITVEFTGDVVATTDVGRIELVVDVDMDEVCASINRLTDGNGVSFESACAESEFCSECKSYSSLNETYLVTFTDAYDETVVLTWLDPIPCHWQGTIGPDEVDMYWDSVEERWEVTYDGGTFIQDEEDPWPCWPYGTYILDGGTEELTVGDV